jgi:hypothetical protein
MKAGILAVNAGLDQRPLAADRSWILVRIGLLPVGIGLFFVGIGLFFVGIGLGWSIGGTRSRDSTARAGGLHHRLAERKGGLAAAAEIIAAADREITKPAGGRQNQLQNGLFAG